MKNIFNKYKIVVVFVLFICLAFVLGTTYGQRLNNSNSVLSNLNIINNTLAASSTEEIDMAPFWKVWKLLDEKYVATKTGDKKLTEQDRVWGAIQGMTSSMGDPYTVFMPPQESEEFTGNISGSFEGVGMEIGSKDNILTVVAPLKGSPAEKAGMKTGDKIVAIDGIPSADFSTDKAVKLIRGPKDTKVKITVLRETSSKTIDIEIVRGIINIPTVDTEIKGDVYVIRLYNFYANSTNVFRDALKSFIDSGKTKLVLDLRGNPGGYLDAAVEMASYFLPIGKTIVREDFGNNTDEVVYRSKGYDVFNENLKMIILVNEGSASASEILAGALRENGKAQLVGIKTYGKGSVQELMHVTPTTSLKVTIARWLTPKGYSISEAGLIPDFEVKLTEKDLLAGKDPQLDKALELLK